VINKTSKIDNVFRTYQMEVLAGEESFEVNHKEGSCTFQFDIRNVYWCSRLQSERERILRKFKKGEVLCDAFCGVGPLSVRAAKGGIKVLANDLNPQCFFYINRNIKLNKIDKKNITTFNMDAREFIRICVGQSKQFKNDEEENFDNKFPVDLRIHHFYMNLPKDAIEFLDVFIGLFTNTKKDIYDKNSLPTVHVYGFSKAKDPRDDLLQRISQAFGMSEKIDDKFIVDFVNVRDVSNNKRVYCISVKIPSEVAYK
jgi:tRNA (guanine37-N1)-methyltransferase